MDDSQLLKVTKSRLISLQLEDRGLYNLTCKFVAKNIGLFIGKNDPRMQLTNLPPSLRQSVFNELTKLTCSNERGVALERNLKAVQLLLSTKTEMFDFDWLLSFYPKHFGGLSKNDIYKQVLGQINSQAPRILTLINSKEEEPYKLSLNPVTLRSDLLSSICIMKSLKELRVRKFLLRLPDLMTLCKNLPCLEHLDISIVCKYNFIVDLHSFKVNLNHLKEFKFKIVSESGYFGDEIRRKLALHCLQLLPNLKVIGECADIRTQFYLDLKADNFLTFPSGLQHLAVRARSSFTKDQYRMLSDVTDLKINFDCRGQTPAWLPLLGFSKVTSLHLEYVPTREMLDCFLRNYGQNLHTLSLKAELMGDDDGLLIDEYEYPTSVSFKDLSRLCPNLEKLRLFGFSDIGDFLPGDSQIFTNLKELTWSKAKCMGESIYEDSPAKLYQILHAPNLEAVTLINIHFDQKDLLEIYSALATHQQILTELRDLKITFFWGQDAEIDTLRACTHFVKTVCAHAQQVKSVKFDVSPGNRDYEFEYGYDRTAEEDAFAALSLHERIKSKDDTLLDFLAAFK